MVDQVRRQLQAKEEVWPLARTFRIARGSRDEARVVVVHITEGDLCGFGEGYPYPRYGESVDSVLEQISSAASAIEVGAGRQELQKLLPAGAARNAIDCALWDIEAKQSGKSVAALAGLGQPGEIITAQTIGIDTPEAMRASAAELASITGAPLLKVKLDADQVIERLTAVRQAAPDARLIVDANESWDVELLASLMPSIQSLGVALLEQPLPAGKDAALGDIKHLVPLCADESCHATGDLARLAGLYDFVNIKLDKTGGLTEALALAKAATEQGFGIMLGCMISTSLAIAPAALLAGFAEFVDLDGPWWLKGDRAHPVRFSHGKVILPEAGLWGDPQ